MNTLTPEATNVFHLPMRGMKLKRFLNVEQLNPVAEALGRPITNAERRMLLDWEYDLSGKPVLHRCECGARYHGVWWRIPKMAGYAFFERIRKTGDLKEAISRFEEVMPIFGSHYMEDGKIVSYCGDAFPQMDPRQGSYEHSCLRAKASKNEKLLTHEIQWGMSHSKAMFKLQKLEEKIAEAAERRARRLADKNAQKRQEECTKRMQERTVVTEYAAA